MANINIAPRTIVNVVTGKADLSPPCALIKNPKIVKREVQVRPVNKVKRGENRKVDSAMSKNKLHIEQCH